jgi:hypothetical protein
MHASPYQNPYADLGEVPRYENHDTPSEAS